jgi:hypothetical protein
LPAARQAVLLLPEFRLQAARRFRDPDAAAPVAVVAADGKICACSAAAAAGGVRAGMPGVQGLARCPALQLWPRAGAAEQAVQQALLELADSLSPEIEATGEACCTLDLRRSGTSDWNAWCAAVLARFTALELHGKVGIAPNPDLAFLAARRADSFLVVQAPPRGMAPSTHAYPRVVPEPRPAIPRGCVARWPWPSGTALASDNCAPRKLPDMARTRFSAPGLSSS